MALASAEHDATILRVSQQCEAIFSQLSAETKKPENAGISNRLEESEYQFQAWTAYLGVFASNEKCLDRQLRHHIHLRDITVRYLDILLSNLQRISTILSRGSSHESSSPDTAADEARRAELAAGLDAALAAVNQALGRLNRTGTSIRRLPTTSNTLIVEPDIPGSQEFKKAALSCVQALYSRASPELQEHLGESITAARNDVITRKLCQEQRMTRAHRITPLEALPEDESTTLTSQGTTHWPPATMTLPAELGIQRPKSERSAVSGSSASELSRSERSSIENSLSITNLTAPSSYIRPKAQKKSTFSVQGNQIYYPLPPQPRKNSNFITCEWCLETHSKELLEGSNWRSHVRSDFKAFICLSETCPGPVRTFPRFSEWHEHMISVHGETWYQEVYPPMAWVCPICRHGRSEFIEPQDLHDHLELDHGLTELQREAVVHQSRIPTKRPPNICFLCCLPVDDDDWHVLDGRKREHTSPTSHRRAKRARVDIGDSTTPSRYQQDDPTQSPPERPGDEISNLNSEPTKRMSEHIARHLESLMLVAIRLMSIGRVDEGQLGEQADHPSDSVVTATTSRYSSLEYQGGKSPLRFDSPTPEDVELSGDSTEEPLRQSALDALNDDLGSGEMTDPRLKTWLSHSAVKSFAPVESQKKHLDASVDHAQRYDPMPPTSLSPRSRSFSGSDSVNAQKMQSWNEMLLPEAALTDDNDGLWSPALNVSPVPPSLIGRSLPTARPQLHEEVSVITDLGNRLAADPGDSSDSDYGSSRPLLERLNDAKVGSMCDPGARFIPRRRLVKLLNKDAVRKELSRRWLNWRSLLQPGLPAATDLDYEVERICTGVSDRGFTRNTPQRPLRKIMAILVLLEKPLKIRRFLEEDIGDEDLPFTKQQVAGSSTKWEFRSFREAPSSPNKIARCFKGWSGRLIADFERQQWTVLSPVFAYGADDHRTIYNWDLPEETILPFLSYHACLPGVYGQVFEVEIHPDHHAFDTNSSAKHNVFAVKRLKSGRMDDFRRHTKLLKVLSRSRPHENLITLLATYEHRGHYHLIFPWAGANLLSYWEKINPRPTKDKTTAIWLLRQCSGLAEGLARIHRFDTSSNSSLFLLSESQARRQRPMISTPSEGDANDHSPVGLLKSFWSYHGNIKPANILWFPGGHSDGPTKLGTLKFTDYGITGDYGIPGSIPSNVSYCDAQVSPELPPIGPQHDIWALGCVYLEFVTWLSDGWGGVDEFCNRRGADDKMLLASGVKIPTFYSLDSSVPPRPILKAAVIQRINALQVESLTLDTYFIRDFVSLISNHLLVADLEHDNRSSAMNIARRLHDIEAKVDSDLV